MSLNTKQYDSVHASAKQWAMNFAQDLIDSHNDRVKDCDEPACKGIHCMEAKFKIPGLKNKHRMNNVLFITEGIMYSSGYWAKITGRFVKGVAHVTVDVHNMTPEEYNENIDEEYRISKEDNPENDLD